MGAIISDGWIPYALRLVIVSSVYFCVWHALEPRLLYVLNLPRWYSKYCVPIMENGVLSFFGISHVVPLSSADGRGRGLNFVTATAWEI